MTWARSLKGGAWLFALSWCIHTADHARRGLFASPEGVIWGGTFVAILATAAITVIFSGHSVAPIMAAAVFPAIAFGVAASHFLPEWGPLSDPILIDSVSDGWSIPAVSAEIAAAAWLGWVALRIVRRNNYSHEIPVAAWS